MPKFRPVSVGALLMLIAILGLARAWVPLTEDTSGAAREVFGKLPLSFEVNRGQVDAQVKYLARGPGHGIFLTSNELVLAVQRPVQRPEERRTGAVSESVRMALLGANPTPRVAAAEELEGRSHYRVGTDSSKWISNVPHYAKVEYEAVYPGIDLIYYGRDERLEYDFVIAPGADPRAIRLQFTGARELRLDPGGDLVLSLHGGDIRQHKPIAYQDIDGERRTVESRYVLRGNAVAFELGPYDERELLVIDPILAYSTIWKTARC
jgi:hypothetical protein